MEEIFIIVVLFLLIGYVVSKVQEKKKQKEFNDLIKSATEYSRRVEENEERHKMRIESGRTIE